MTEVTVSNNEAGTRGGGIFSDGNLWITDSSGSGNTAIVSGGIYTEDDSDVTP